MNNWIRRSLQVGTVSAGIVLAGAAAAQAHAPEQHSGLTTAKAGIVNQAAEVSSVAKGGTKNTDDTDPGIPAGAKPSGGNANNAQEPANEGRPAGVNSDYSTTPAGQAQGPEDETTTPAAAPANPAPAAAPANPAPAAAPANPAPANPAPAAGNNGGAVPAQPVGGGQPVAGGQPVGGGPAVVGNGGAVVVRPIVRPIIVVDDDDDDDDFGFIGVRGPRFGGGWGHGHRWDECGGHRHSRWDCDRFDRRYSCGRWA